MPLQLAASSLGESDGLESSARSRGNVLSLIVVLSFAPEVLLLPDLTSEHRNCVETWRLRFVQHGICIKVNKAPLASGTRGDSTAFSAFSCDVVDYREDPVFFGVV